MELFDLAQFAYQAYELTGAGRHVIWEKREKERQGVNGLNWDSVKAVEYKKPFPYTPLSTLLKGRLPC